MQEGRMPTWAIGAPMIGLGGAQVMRKTGHIYAPQTIEYDDAGEDDPEDARFEADKTAVRLIGERLNEEYPGHPWYVEVSYRQGIAKISIPILMGDNFYILHLVNMTADMRQVARAGGEILERYQLRRGAFNREDFRAACAKRSFIERRNGFVPD